jgi:hypothetical protein
MTSEERSGDVAPQRAVCYRTVDMTVKFKTGHLLACGAAMLAAACASAPATPNPAPDCFRPHWRIPFKAGSLRRIEQRPFQTHLGARRFLTFYSPGPFKASYFFVMSPDPSEDSIAGSPHIGVLFDSNRDGKADCVILAGGTLPDANGRAVAYNFFAIDRDGNGQIEEFLSEDLDLDGDRVMDPASVAVMAEPDPAGHFGRGTYLMYGENHPIPKEGGFFLLQKPIFKVPFRFADDEVTKMTLFTALQEIWEKLEGGR